jgi:uncharacterized membrane protein YdjX (TVP38/TMEM64 family)
MDGERRLPSLLSAARSRTPLTYLAVGLLLLAAIVIAGQDIAHHVAALEAWIANLGPWGIVTFIGLFVAATTLLLPESLLSIMAGALFGLVTGLATVVAANLLAAALQYALSRRLLRARVQRSVDARPSLAAIQRTVSHNELRLQALLRLTPLNPALVSYLLGAAGVRFAGYMLACLAFTPHLLIEVYFGYAGRHVARMAGRGTRVVYLHDFVVLGGLAITVIVTVVVTRLAHKAVMEAVSAARDDRP